MRFAAIAGFDNGKPTAYGRIDDLLFGPRWSVSTQVRRRFMVADDLQVATQGRHAFSNSSNRETFSDDQKTG